MQLQLRLLRPVFNIHIVIQKCVYDDQRKCNASCYRSITQMYAYIWSLQSYLLCSHCNQIRKAQKQYVPQSLIGHVPQSLMVRFFFPFHSRMGDDIHDEESAWNEVIQAIQGPRLKYCSVFNRVFKIQRLC